MFTHVLRLIAVIVLILLTGQECTPPCQQYGCPHYPQPSYFLPAPPGKSPPCAKHGKTYCEHIDHYPVNVIQHLVERWQYDYNSLFSSEKNENEYGTRPIYGLPQSHGHQGNKHSTQPPQTDGYPDRKYNLGSSYAYAVSDDPEFIYSAIIHPDLKPTTSYDRGQWWRRFTRSTRRKRQQGTPISLCPTSSQFIMPRAAVNSKGNWVYVVNLDQDRRYTQLVRSETCISTECNGICSLPNGYTSKCEQQFVQKRLVALGGTGDMLYTDLFWLPHCCICKIMQNIR